MEARLLAFRIYFSQVWQKFFYMEAPRLYVTPKIVSYLGGANSGCGRIGAGNASFCSVDNTIYYDREFLAAEMISVGAGLHSDGGYAAVVILAHEWGHAADYWYRRQDTKLLWGEGTNELRADCLAGAVTLAAKSAGRLSPVDLQEAENAIQSAGEIDVSSLLPTNPYRRQTELEELKTSMRKLAGHGDPAKRLQAFRNGYTNGARACLEPSPVKK